jgi:hypothetical protein
MVPIPADPQRDLEDESTAVQTKASSTGICPQERLFESLPHFLRRYERNSIAWDTRL